MRKLERNNQIHKDVKGGSSFSELAKKYKISNTTVRWVYLKTDQEIKYHGDLYGLGNRTINALKSIGIKTKDEAKKAIELGEIYPFSLNNYGKKTHDDLCDFLGIKAKKSATKNINRYITYLKKHGFEVTLKQEKKNG